MKNLHFLSTIILGCLLFCSIQMPLLAQEKSDSMKLSKSFMKELESALGKYLRPEEIRLRTMRQIADKARKAMDLYYPTTGLPAFGTKETPVLAKETQLADTSSVKR